MKERRILMSGPMVMALLESRKSQTRRIAKPFKRFPQYNVPCTETLLDKSSLWWWDGVHSRAGVGQDCPYGRPGDRLYVKEEWRTAECLDAMDATEIAAKCLDAGYNKPWTPMKYEADGSMCSNWHGFGSGHEQSVPGRYRQAGFMPRWASRLTLRITDVRVERLNEISEADAIAEGATSRPNCTGYHQRNEGWSMDWSKVGSKSRWSWNGKTLSERDIALGCARTAFGNYWECINGNGSWSENPFVWVVSFEVVDSIRR